MDELSKVQAEINQVIKGKEDVVKKVLAALIAGGHVLMEDIPGVGKTTLAMAFARVMGLSCRRVQFTPDVLPGDISGFSMYSTQTKEFEFREGAVFCNLLLADEINRTSPKTQSALLEVMEEKKVTIDSVTRVLPQPFMVIATENPYGSSGTQMLPESQLDRFLICLSMGYPEHEDAVAILKNSTKNLLEQLNPVINAEKLIAFQKDAEQIYVHDELFEYITNLTEKTRELTCFSMGVSPRGGVALLRMAKGMAILEKRSYMLPEDIQNVLKDVFGHRVVISSKAHSEGITLDEAMETLLKAVKAPRI